MYVDIRSFPTAKALADQLITKLAYLRSVALGAPLREILKHLATKTIAPDPDNLVALIHSSKEAYFKFPRADLKTVDRSVTPGVVIITHIRWFNTYNAHYLEGEVVHNAVEYFVRKYHPDAVFAGHVHSYELFKRLYLYEQDECAPLYVTIGDGGNREEPATQGVRT
ncbi:hypothetical protein R1flu_014457 [Riccia fluitans]|uniref:Calcineurin-like phosphoesterase domain-containing protein n=1 Tax=Riccia fluitans TaxID=41844 RepID=A0ABD1YG53_9MARC